MPPFSRIRIPVLIELVEQQRYTPARTLVRQVERAEVLAGEIDGAITYPEDWVVFRITGFRPDLEDPRMIPGESLRADLSALVERLSDQARLRRESIEGETLTLDELSERWSVSRKSIERYRRRGLVGRRIAGEGGATRLVFTRRAVEAFERENESGLGEASGFTRLGDEDRRRIVERSRRYRARLGWTRNQIIGRLGVRFGRSREAVRRVLEGHEEAASAEARLAPDARRAIFEAERGGAVPEELAERFDRSRASIHRIVNARRCDLLRRLDLTVPRELRGEAARHQMDAALESEGSRQGLGVDVVLDGASWIEEARGSRPAPAGEERARALAYHALRDRARSVVEGMDRSNPSAMALDRAETDLRWAAMLKRALVHAERALVLRTLEERVGRGLLELASSELGRLHRVSYETVIAVVDRYLPVRGGRLAAPVSLALGRRLGHELGGGEEALAGRATPIHGVGGAVLHDWTRDVAAWQSWLDPPPGLEAVLGGLDEQSRQVATARFGLGGESPRTFDGIEVETGVSRRRSVVLVRGVVRESVRARAGA